MCSGIAEQTSIDVPLLLQRWPPFRKRLTAKTPPGAVLVAKTVQTFLWIEVDFDGFSSPFSYDENASNLSSGLCRYELMRGRLLYRQGSHGSGGSHAPSAV